MNKHTDLSMTELERSGYGIFRGNDKRDSVEVYWWEIALGSAIGAILLSALFFFGLALLPA